MARPNKYQKIIDIKHEKPHLTWTKAARAAGFTVGNFTSSGRKTKDGKAIPKLKNKEARARQAKRRALDMKFDKELLVEIERQEKLGNLDADAYFADRARRFDEYKKALAKAKESGAKIDDGHLTDRKNSSPDARAPEPAHVNQNKRDTQPVSALDMAEAFLPRSDVEDLYNYMAPSGMPKVGSEERSRMLSGEISGQQALAIADRNDQLSRQSISDYEVAIEQDNRFRGGDNAMASQILAIFKGTANRAGEKILRNAAPGVGTALDWKDTGQRWNEFMEDPNLINGAQLVTQAVSSTANTVSDVALATGVGAPIAAKAEGISGLATIADAGLEGLEGLQGLTSKPK